MSDEYRAKLSLYELGCMIQASMSSSLEAGSMEEQAVFDAGTQANLEELRRRDAARQSWPQGEQAVNALTRELQRWLAHDEGPLQPTMQAHARGLLLRLAQGEGSDAN